MPSADSSGPKWLHGSRKLHRELVASYKQSIDNIAELIARYESSESVLRSHVQNAHEALARQGLSRRRLRRNHLVLWVSGLLLGGSASFFAATWPVLGMVMLVLGAALAVHSWTVYLH